MKAKLSSARSNRMRTIGRRGSAVLTIVSGPHRGASYRMELGQTILLGRARDVRVTLPEDAEVSRRHALLELREEGLYVTDLGSRNGTHIGVRRCRPDTPTLVPVGVALSVGQSQVAVEIVGLAAETQISARPLYCDAPELPEDEFEILGAIGSGGMGKVWSAKQFLLDRAVAVKVMHSELLDQEEEYKRFLREARLYCRVKSPHVVELHDVRLLGGEPCLIMELVRGPSAGDRVYDGPLSLRECITIGEHISRALEATSRAGVVHRDVKPDNIFLAPDGTAKLGDFGISKEVDGSTALTDHGVGLGSLPYIAPEQALGSADLDVRADIYALGATLYHLVTGAPHFVCMDTGNVMEVYENIQRTPDPLSVVRPGCPRELSDLVEQMMAQDPAQRPADAADLAERFRALRERLYPEVPAELGETTRPGNQRRRPQGVCAA